jgi:hypothetical protein
MLADPLKEVVLMLASVFLGFELNTSQVIDVDPDANSLHVGEELAEGKPVLRI